MKMSVLQVGQVAPDFTLPASNGEPFQLSAQDQIIALYFYPKDDTPGCTSEACAFRDLSEEFASVGAKIVGISPDSLKKHGKFIEKHQLPFLLLADEDHAVSELYGVWKEKSMYGRKYFGIERTTLVIDREGVIRFLYPKVSVTGHVQQVLKDVKTLS